MKPEILSTSRGVLRWVQMAVAVALSSALAMAAPTEADARPKKGKIHRREMDPHVLERDRLARDKALIEKMRQAVVFLEIAGPEKNRRRLVYDCTSFILNDRTLVTADHCMAKGRRLIGMMGFGEAPPYQYVPSLKRDVGMIRFDEPIFLAEHALPLATWGPKPGEALMTAGRYSSNQLAVRVGTFVRAKSELYALSHLGSIQGESGGPVVNKKGEVVGVISRGDQQFYTSSAPVYPALIEFMKRRLPSPSREVSK